MAVDMGRVAPKRGREAKTEQSRSLVAAVFLPADARARVWLLGGLIGVMWLVFLVDQLAFGGALQQFGVVPRTVSGLIGIPCADFLHENFAHIANNSLGLFIFGWLVLDHGRRRFVVLTVVVILVSGALDWCFARKAVHIGASGLVYGLLGYVVAHGFFARQFWAIARSIFYGVTFSGMVLGLLPNDPHISWEGHLFGLIVGIAMARLLARPKLPTTKRTPAAR
jgi:membrane associated rhomboid family serine protease